MKIFINNNTIKEIIVYKIAIPCISLYDAILFDTSFMVKVKVGVLGQA